MPAHSFPQWKGSHAIRRDRAPNAHPRNVPTAQPAHLCTGRHGGRGRSRRETPVRPDPERADRDPGVRRQPFKLGVASGDPRPDGVVLWTRLAPEAARGDGGMGPDPVTVGWQVAEDERMPGSCSRGRRGHRGPRPLRPRGAAGTRAGALVLVPLPRGGRGLACGAHPHGAAAGQPSPSASASPSRPASTGIGLYTAYRDMLCRQDLDLVVHLGDYIYEYGIGLGEQLRPGDYPSEVMAQTGHAGGVPDSLCPLQARIPTCRKRTGSRPGW